MLRELTARDPRNAEAFYNLGVALKQNDDFKGAEAALRRAVELGGTLAEAPFTLGVVLWQTGRPHEAIDMFRQAIARRADYDDAHYMLGTVLQQAGESEAALSEFRRGDSAASFLRRGAPQSRPAPAAARRCAPAPRRRSTKRGRLNQKKADVQASTFAVGVGRARAASGDVAVPSSSSSAPWRSRRRTSKRTTSSRRRSPSLGRPDAARTHLLEARRLAPHLRFRDP